MRLLHLTFVLLLFTSALYAQKTDIGEQEKLIYDLVDRYARARESKDGNALKSILTSDVDQLVSSGTWRRGRDEALSGMMKSSKARPGSRTINVHRVRFLNASCAIADARYEIQNQDGTLRKMWSTFVVLKNEGSWKISAIRNMLPARRS